jgi:hypothetical protein
MKTETSNRNLSSSTIRCLSSLLRCLLEQPNKSVIDNATYRSIGMVLATPTVGVLAKAEPARSALREELAFLKMDCDSRLHSAENREQFIKLHREITADLEFGRRF